MNAINTMNTVNAVRPQPRMANPAATGAPPRQLPRPRAPPATQRLANANNIQTTGGGTVTVTSKGSSMTVVKTSNPQSYGKAPTVSTSAAQPAPSSSSSFNIDLEDSITAAKISKQKTTPPPLLATASAQNMTELLDTSIGDENKVVTLQNGHVLSLAGVYYDKF